MKKDEEMFLRIIDLGHKIIEKHNYDESSFVTASLEICYTYTNSRIVNLYVKRFDADRYSMTMVTFPDKPSIITTMFDNEYTNDDPEKAIELLIQEFLV